jgi:hypothetical protein
VYLYRAIGHTLLLGRRTDKERCEIGWIFIPRTNGILSLEWIQLNTIILSVLLSLQLTSELIY